MRLISDQAYATASNAAILRMRAAGLKRHHERLSGGVHDRIGHFKTSLVEPS